MGQDGAVVVPVRPDFPETHKKRYSDISSTDYAKNSVSCPSLTPSLPASVVLPQNRTPPGSPAARPVPGSAVPDWTRLAANRQVTRFYGNRQAPPVYFSQD